MLEEPPRSEDAAPRRKRELTELQATVIDSMLAGEPGSERERIRLSGLAPRTYQVTRRRALDQKWVAERFVPDPTLFDRPELSLALARPRPGTMDSAVNRWCALAGAVLIWKTNERLFGLFSDRPKGSPTAVARELGAKDGYDSIYLLELDLTTPALPIYFDFEGEWAKVARIPGITFYPRPLPRRPRGSTRGRSVLTARWREILRQLARIGCGPPTAGPAGPDSPLRFGERAALARGLRNGWLDRRAFLDPSSIPPYRGWSLEQVVLIHGELREGRRPQVLLHTLFAACGVTPFLFATAGQNLLFATLSPAPPEPARARRGVSVSGTLARFLDHVVVDRLPVAELETVVDHRTDLFAGA